MLFCVTAQRDSAATGLLGKDTDSRTLEGKEGG